jgi:hypothetical protein
MVEQLGGQLPQLLQAHTMVAILIYCPFTEQPIAIALGICAPWP